MALRLTKLADEAIQWLREKYETLRNQLTIGRSRMSKDPYRIISEGTREKEIQLGHMYFMNYDPKWKNTLKYYDCLLYTSPSPRDKRQSRMPSSA